jgi:hypothetical protein
VALVKTDFSKECIASIIRVERIDKLGTVLAVTSNKSHTASQPRSGIVLSVPFVMQMKMKFHTLYAI